MRAGRKSPFQVLRRWKQTRYNKKKSVQCGYRRGNTQENDINIMTKTLVHTVSWNGDFNFQLFSHTIIVH